MRSSADTIANSEKLAMVSAELSAGGVDGLLVEEIGHVLPAATQDADKSVMQLHRRTLQKDEVA